MTWIHNSQCCVRCCKRRHRYLLSSCDWRLEGGGCGGALVIIYFQRTKSLSAKTWKGVLVRSSVMSSTLTLHVSLTAPPPGSAQISCFISRKEKSVTTWAVITLSHCLSCLVRTLQFVPPKTHLKLLTSQSGRGRKDPNRSSDVIPSTSTYMSRSTESLHRNVCMCDFSYQKHQILSSLGEFGNKSHQRVNWIRLEKERVLEIDQTDVKSHTLCYQTTSLLNKIIVELNVILQAYLLL